MLRLWHLRCESVPVGCTVSGYLLSFSLPGVCCVRHWWIMHLLLSSWLQPDKKQLQGGGFYFGSRIWRCSPLGQEGMIKLLSNSRKLFARISKNREADRGVEPTQLAFSFSTFTCSETPSHGKVAHPWYSGNVLLTQLILSGGAPRNPSRGVSH